MTGPVAVYVHIPFCTVKCGYCDFNAYAGMDGLKDAYAHAAVQEIHASASLLSGREVTSIGFGGGTPGEMRPEHIAGIIEAVRRVATVALSTEITLEANPGTIAGAALRLLARAGVNRVSFGAQSFLADELRFLDRIHSPEATAAAVSLAREADIQSVGLDLIYGLPGQDAARWRASLDAAIALAPDHISCYALTVEDGTMLARRVQGGEVVVPGGDEVADLYELATDVLEAAGYRQYELSNWARPGHASRHNRTYWTDRDYLGIGAGAHGYIGGERYENIAHPRRYIASMQAASGGPLPAVQERYWPDRDTAIGDWLATRLRLLEGFEPSEFQSRFGESLDAIAGDVFRNCGRAGVLELGPRVRLTRKGRLLHGEVCAELLAHLSRHVPLPAGNS